MTESKQVYVNNYSWRAQMTARREKKLFVRALHVQYWWATETSTQSRSKNATRQHLSFQVWIKMGFLVQTGRIEWFEAEIAKRTSLKMHRPMSMKTEFLLKMAVPG